MAQVHYKILERTPIQTLPRTIVERRQQSAALDNEYEQLYSLHPNHGINDINCLPAGLKKSINGSHKKINRKTSILYLHQRLLGTHHYLYGKSEIYYQRKIQL